MLCSALMQVDRRASNVTAVGTRRGLDSNSLLLSVWIVTLHRVLLSICHIRVSIAVVRARERIQDSSTYAPYKKHPKKTTKTTCVSTFFATARLACDVPELQLHRGLSHHQLFQGEVHPDCRLVMTRKKVVHVSAAGKDRGSGQ